MHEPEEVDRLTAVFCCFMLESSSHGPSQVRESQRKKCEYLMKIEMEMRVNKLEIKCERETEK